MIHPARTIVMIVMARMPATIVATDTGDASASANDESGVNATQSGWHSGNGDAECDGAPVWFAGDGPAAGSDSPGHADHAVLFDAWASGRVGRDATS